MFYYIIVWSCIIIIGFIFFINWRLDKLESQIVTTSPPPEDIPPFRKMVSISPQRLKVLEDKEACWDKLQKEEV